LTTNKVLNILRTTNSWTTCPENRENLAAWAVTLKNGTLHLTSLRTFPARLGAGLAAVGMFGVLATFGGTCFAAFHAEGAQRIGELRIPCAEPGAERTDVGAVTAGFHAGFVPAHGQALGSAFFAFDDTSEAGIYAVLAVFHVSKL
jgi:hypothetical protein